MKLRYGIGYNWNKVRRAAIAGLKKIGFDGLLSGAWFHKKEPTYEVVDETPDVDASRTWHKARALQFTDSTDYVSISKTYPSTNTPTSFEVTLEIITGNSIVSTQDIFCTDDAGQAAGIQLRIENYSSDWRFGLRVGDVVGRDSSFAVQTNTRYILVISYDGTNATLTVNEATNLTITPTSAIAGAGLIMLGRRYTTLGNYFNGILGYVKIKEDNIVIGEYAFEEGEGTICYNRVMNNFHGTINNATISTFRVEDVRITNGDQGTFLNTEGYRDNNKIYSSTDYFWQGAGCTVEADLSFQGKEGVKKVTFPAGTYSNATLQAFHNNALLNLRTTTTADDHTLTYYFPSGQQNNWFRLTSGDSSFQAVEDTWTTVSFSISTNDTRVFMIDGDGDSNLDITTTEDVVIYIGDYVVTEPNVYVPRPRVTDIPLYNAGKYAYYIPDHANNFIDLNTAFAGLTNPGDWMEFGIATVGTGEPDSETGSWATHTSGGSQFFANIASGVDFRFFGPNGGQNQMRTVVASIDIPNNDFYLLKVTKTVEAPAGTSGTVGQLDLFDRDGNLIVSHNLSAGTLGNEGTYTFDRFFPQTYSTDFILAYLKLSDGTVWNGANDFNGGVNITNTGTGNVTKIFFESVDEDVLGNSLTYKGQVAQPLSLVNSNGIRFGAQEQIELTNDLTVSDFTEIAYVYFDSTLASGTFMRAFFFYDTGTSSDGWVTIEYNELRYGNSVTSGTQSAYGYTTEIPNFLDTWQKVGISRTGSEIVIVVGDEVRTVDISAVAAGTNTFEAIGRGGNNPQGDLAWISFHSKGMTAEEIKAIDPYNMDTDSLEVFYAPSTGSGSTVYDLSGNNNHGTIFNATLSDFWIKQDQFHWNLKKGFLKGFGTNNNAYYNLDQALEDPIGKTVKFGFIYNTGSGRQWLFTTDVSDVGSFYVQQNTNGNIQIEQQGVNSVILISASNFTDGHYYEVQFDYPATSDLQTVSTVLVNGTSASFTTSGNIYGSSGNHIGYNSTGSGFPLTDTRIVFIKIGDTLYNELNNWGGATLVNSGSAEYLRVPDLATENVAFAAGKWHNDAETEINFPQTATFEVLNRQFTNAPFFTKNAERYTSDFSSTTDNFGPILGATGGSVAANIDGVTDDAATSFDNCLRYTAASGTNLQHGVVTNMDNILELRTNVDGSNQVFYAEVRFLLPSTNTQINGFRVWTGWGVQSSSNPFNFPQANNDITADAVGAWRKEMFGPFTLTDIGGSTISLRLQGLNGTDFTIDNDALDDLIYIESVRVIQMPTLKDVTFADMYQTWYDYEYLHRLFAHFVVPNQVHNILAYTDELTADQKQQVYDYLQKDYHPIYTPYSTRVLADGGTLAAGKTNTLTIIDSI